MQAIPYIVGGLNVAKGVSSLVAGFQGAATAEQEGESARQAAREEARRIRRRGEDIIGTQRAVAGSQGTTMEGSPLLIEIDTVKSIELDAQDALYRGKLQSVSSEAEANLRRMQGLFGFAGGVAEGVGAGFSLYQSGKLGVPPTRPRAGSTLLTNRYGTP